MCDSGLPPTFLFFERCPTLKDSWEMAVFSAASASSNSMATAQSGVTIYWPWPPRQSPSTVLSETPEYISHGTDTTAVFGYFWSLSSSDDGDEPSRLGAGQLRTGTTRLKYTKSTINLRLVDLKCWGVRGFVLTRQADELNLFTYGSRGGIYSIFILTNATHNNQLS